jgi:L-glyceraldehyde 3-phosphate reductase
MMHVTAEDRYTVMPYRRSGLMLPEVSLGLWQNFGDSQPLAGQRTRASWVRRRYG